MFRHPNSCVRKYKTTIGSEYFAPSCRKNQLGILCRTLKIVMLSFHYIWFSRNDTPCSKKYVFFMVVRDIFVLVKCFVSYIWSSSRNACSSFNKVRLQQKSQYVERLVGLSSIRFHEVCSPVIGLLRTDGRTDMAELIAVILQLFVTHEQRHSVYGLL